MMGQNVYLALLTPRWYSIQTTQGAGPGQGYASQQIAVPSDPTLAGLQFFGQWMIGDPAGPFGFTTSDAFQATIF